MLDDTKKDHTFNEMIMNQRELSNLLMLRLISSKAQEQKVFYNSSKSCHVGIHWIALAEYSQMSTHVPRF